MTMAPTVLASRNNGVMDQPEEHEQDPAARPRRRMFTAEKKLELLAEYDAADREGKGALLRREAIYTSHISEWRKARDRGSLHAPATRKRKSAEQVELERLRERNEKLEAELAKTWPRSRRCTGSCVMRARAANDAASGPIQPRRNRSCARPAPTSAGRGTSPDCKGRPAGCSTTCT
jgi:transposase